jgi:hypothetical protein
MFRSLSYDHHQGSITVLVQLLFISVHTSSYSDLWLYVVGVLVRAMYLSCGVWLCIAVHSQTPHGKVQRTHRRTDNIQPQTGI